MENPEPTTTITSKNAILRIMHGIFEQNTPLIISTGGTGEDKEYLSSISRIEEENNQLVLHQISPDQPGDWRELIQPTEETEITCYMQQGAIKFVGSLSPLDDSETLRYCRLTLPTQLSKTQMRSGFRVSLGKFDSKASIELRGGGEVFGTCRDLSLAGALFHVPVNNEEIELDYDVRQFRVLINGSLDLSCPAKVCHVHNTATDKYMLVGLNFQDLKSSQLEAIRSAIIKLERLNITK